MVLEICFAPYDRLLFMFLEAIFCNPEFRGSLPCLGNGAGYETSYYYSPWEVTYGLSFGTEMDNLG